MAVTQGRNEGRKTRTTKTMTSSSQERVTNTRRAKSAEPVTTATETETQVPTMYINRRAPVDVLDTGLEDSQWHYVWVNKDDAVGLTSYYNDGYRFVKFDDVKEQLEQDELRIQFYTEDVAGRVSYGDQNRLMRIPQQVYKDRIRAAINGYGEYSAADKARQLFEHTLEDSKYAGQMDKNVQVSADADNGTVETKTLQDEGGSN